MLSFVCVAMVDGGGGDSGEESVSGRLSIESIAL